jgi:hypothetical protein
LKKVISILVLLLILAIVGISGCTNSNNNSTTKPYAVLIQNSTDLSNFTDSDAASAVEPSSNDAQMGINVTDHGTKTINGIKVYYDAYTDSSDNSTNGDLYFKKGNTWHLITWKDVQGNPNKAAIENEIEAKINSI